jgi:hypothetical protein
MKSGCPNIDKQTLSALQTLKLSTTPQNRKIIFYFVCVVLRLFIAGVAYQYRDSVWLPYVIILVCLPTIYRLYTQLEGNFWWSRKFHCFICSLLVISSLFVISGKLSGKYLSYLLYIDVMGGFLHSLMINRC